MNRTPKIEAETRRGYEHILCEDFDESMLLAAHIRFA